MASASPAMSGYEMPTALTGRGVPITSAAAPLQSRRSNGSSGSTNNNTTSCMAPTWYGFVHTTHDALMVLEACLQGKLHHIPRRPHDRERGNIISSGNVFIYEENASGIKRWTDGVTWSPSRIMGNFLVYRELNEPFPAGEKKKAKKRKRGAEEVEPVENLTGQSEEDRKLVGSLVDSYGFKPGGLIKKTMNLKYQNVNHHIVSYYNLQDVKQGTYHRPNFDPVFDGIKPRPDLAHHQFKANAFDTEDVDPWDSSPQQNIIPTPNMHGHLVRHDSPQLPNGLSQNSQSLVPHINSSPITSSIGHQHVQQTSLTSIPTQYNHLQSTYQPHHNPSYQHFLQPQAMAMSTYPRRTSIVPEVGEYPYSLHTAGNQSSLLTPAVHALDMNSPFAYPMSSAQPNTFNTSSPDASSWTDDLADNTPAPTPKRRHTGPALINGINSGMYSGFIGDYSTRFSSPHPPVFNCPVSDHHYHQQPTQATY